MKNVSIIFLSLFFFLIFYFIFLIFILLDVLSTRENQNQGLRVACVKKL